METGRTKKKDSLIIGFAVFSIFFGAGNLIFPPQIGLMAGEQVGIAIVGMIITGVLFPMLAMAAVANMGKNLKDLTIHITPWWHNIYFGASIMILLFGTIPRCGSIAFEIGVGGIFTNLPHWSKWVFLIIFFGLSWIVASNNAKVVDVIGKYVTPILLIALMAIIILAVVNPVGHAEGKNVDNPFTYAMLTSYNTGDIGTGILCSGIFLSTIMEKGYTTKKERTSIMFKALIIAFILLAIVYGGLCYLGSEGTNLFDAEIEQTALLISLVNRLAGYAGMVILSLAIIFACFSTAAGMIATGGEWVSEWVRGKISFKIITLIMSIIIMMIASLGAKNVVKLASPLFMFIFPMSVVMTIYGLLHKVFPNDGVLKGAIYICTLVSIYDAVKLACAVGLLSLDLSGMDRIMMNIPLAQYGFSWVIPTIIGGIIGGIVYKLSSKNTSCVENNI